MVSNKSWSDIVKGKENIRPTVQKKKKFNPAVAEFVPRKKAISVPLPPTEEKFEFNAEAPEFSVPELKMNALAQEFVPPVSQGLNPLTKEFIPPQHKLLNKAAEMQKLLLECYTDDDDSSDDEPEAPVVQKRTQATAKPGTAVLPFRPPPGLPPPDAALNPLAKAFDPSQCFANGKTHSPAPALQNAWIATGIRVSNAINISGFYSEDEDDESIVSTPRELSKLDQISIHDSTSAGESSDSETESWSGLHSP